MTVVKNPGVNCADVFDDVFSTAHQIAASPAKRWFEPDLVRQLISNSTVASLNTVSSSLYDSSQNIVKFRALYLHGSPIASFDAHSLPVGNSANRVQCRRELADAMLVVQVSEPDAKGVHAIVRRSAVLLMFKKSNSSTPAVPRYNPGSGILPVGSDQQQFYLYNQWPSFDLWLSSKSGSAGVFDVRPGGSPVSHDIGKFALVWDPRINQSNWSVGARDVHWLAGDPLPGFSINPATHSLGHQLDALIDGASGNVGRDFHPQPAAAGNWDGLMGTLLGYSTQSGAMGGSNPVGGILDHATWNRLSRHANPAALSLMAAGGMASFEAASLLHSTLVQGCRDGFRTGLLRSGIRCSSIVLERMNPFRPFDEPAGPRRFPVLVASVTRFNSAEGSPVREKRPDDLDIGRRELLRELSRFALRGR